MNLTPEERNLTAHILDKYVDLLIKETDGKLPSPKVMRHIEQLEIIKSVFGKIEEDIKLEENQKNQNEKKLNHPSLNNV